LLPAFCTGLAVAGAEMAARVIDGYALSSVRLDKLPERLARPSLPVRLRRSGVTVDAAGYAAAVAGGNRCRSGVVRAVPPPRPFPQPDAELAARAKRYQGAELPANYEWNAQAVVNAVCKGDLRNVVAFDRFEDVYEFDAIDGSDLPTFRFLQHATYPSGLRTNAFGWRGPEIAFKKPPHTLRIAFVGASTTVSPHAEPYSYPELVGFWLNTWAASQRPGVAIEVVNAGREALTSRSF
jgi:hypothetical protein